MKQICSVASKAPLAMLLMCVIMLFIVAPGSAEWVIMMISAGMMAVLLATSIWLLRRECKKEEDKT